MRNVVAGACACMLVVAATARAQESVSVPRSAIPKVVTNALMLEFPDAMISSCTREKEDGVVVYDIAFQSKGLKREADVTEKGALLNAEQAIQAGELPRQVRAAIDSRYPGAALKEVMEETAYTANGTQRAAYEIVLRPASGNELRELRVSPEGKILEDERVGSTPSQR